jgi:signal transduction histidine kinase
MRLCFYQRIAVIVVSVFMLILVLFFIASSHLQSHTRNEAEQKMQQNLASHLVNSNPLLRYGVSDLAALKSLFSSLMLLDPSVEFYYLDETGSIIAHSAGSEIALRKSIDLTPILEFIEAPGNFPLRADDPKNSQTRKIFSASPIFKDGELQGYLYVILGSQQYDSILAELKESQALREFILFVSAGLVALLVVMLVLFKLITSPLRQLSHDMIAFRQAGYKLSKAQLSQQTWCADSRSEIDKLGCAFNELFAHVDAQFHALERTNEQRKEMLADLSHDLRTPLASMNGYIETLQLQGDALSSEDKAKFMAICMRNMNNLKQLIDQIFELAYLEGGQVSLACEPVVLGEFLHDIVTKFSLAAKDKNISINVEPKQFECFVNTDLAKLERVLSNLIDNAIRHTPGNGNVTIRATTADKYIILGVEDTGIGIKAGELKDIFLPRYQASNSRKEAGHNVGLGLAISQKLVLLLGSTLQVKSRPGEGTCFSFSLKKA